MTKEHQAPYDFNRVKAYAPQEPNMINVDKMLFLRTFAFIAPNPRFDPSDPYLARRRYVNAVEARIYETKNGGYTICKFWAHSRDDKTCTRGFAKSSGYGYHRESAAIDGAVECAGFQMLAHFNGYGEESARIALEAIAKKLGWKTGQLMTFHP